MDIRQLRPLFCIVRGEDFLRGWPFAGMAFCGDGFKGVRENPGGSGLLEAERAYANDSLSPAHNAENLSEESGTISADGHMKNFSAEIPAKRSQIPTILIFFFCLFGHFCAKKGHMPLPFQIPNYSP